MPVQSSRLDRIRRLVEGFRNYGNPFSLAVGRWLRKPIVEVVDRHTGLRFICAAGADRMFGEVFHSRLYDVPGVPIRAGDQVVDVGANHGFATCYFASKGAHVISYEPDPDVFARLCANVSANQLDSRVSLNCAAVTSSSTGADLFVTKELGGGMTSTIERFVQGTGVPVDRRLRVPSSDLGSILRAIDTPRVRLVKLDCEGAEVEILDGLPAEARDRIDAFALEFHPQAYSLQDLVSKILSWPGFHLSKAVEHETANANLFLVHERALNESASVNFR